MLKDSTNLTFMEPGGLVIESFLAMTEVKKN